MEKTQSSVRKTATSDTTAEKKKNMKMIIIRLD